jgi:hypothetical protein
MIGGETTGSPDEDKIKAAKNLTQTQKKMLLDARIGQGEFRKALLREWERCAVTGCQLPQLLRASHIKPWKVANNRERLDRDNGLLLLASLDAAFENGFISFADSGKMVISPELTPETRALLGVADSTCLSRGPAKNRQKYLNYHRRKWSARLYGNKRSRPLSASST